MTQQNSQTLFQQAAQFDRSTLSERCQAADRERAEIQQLFPIGGWPTLALERYALGMKGGERTYCSWLEFNSPNLGSIGGGSSTKHIIYKKGDGTGWYIPKEYANEVEAWDAVRSEFCRAFDLLRASDLAAIDQLPNVGNKALLVKTLHIYFPDEMLPISSGAHLKHFLALFGIPDSQYLALGRVQQNRLLLTTLKARAEFRGWSTAEIGFFLYQFSHPGEFKFAAPFDQLFADQDEANWAFDLIAETARKLGVTAATDPRWALVYRHQGNRHWLRTNFGQWAALDVAGESGALTEVVVLLYEDEAQGGTPTGRAFKEKTSGRNIFLHKFPAAAMREPDPDLQAAIDRALELLKSKFGGWKSTQFKRFASKTAEAAVFDSSMRRSLFTGGLSKIAQQLPDDPQLPEDEPQDPVVKEPPPPVPNSYYTLESCAADLCADVETIQTWIRHIERKKQAVLYGPPGTGKTFAAQKLARHLVSGGDGFVELVQFHPAYAYEDFIQGLRPQVRAEGGLDYAMVKGRFLEFCARARARAGRCVLILDEFNRANLARVLGELMYLLEYRDETAPLAGGGTLSIPSNVVILGTMNTADRSIALVDHALRRRFAFIAVQPNYDSLRRFHAKTGAGFDTSGLIEVLEQVNREIGDPNYALGVSFFMLPRIATILPDVWRAEIEPYLEEYFFDKPGTVSGLRWDKVKARILNQPPT